MTLTNAYQPVNISNVSSIGDMVNYVNASGGGWLFTGIDVLVFFVIFISLTAVYGWEAAMLSAGFIGIILSLLLTYARLMAWTTTGIFVGIILAMIMYIVWSNRNN